MDNEKILLQRTGSVALIAWQSSNEDDVEFITTIAYGDDGTWDWGSYFGNNLQRAFDDYKKKVEKRA